MRNSSSNSANFFDQNLEICSLLPEEGDSVSVTGDVEVATGVYCRIEETDDSDDTDSFGFVDANGV